MLGLGSRAGRFRVLGCVVSKKKGVLEHNRPEICCLTYIQESTKT